MTTPFSKERYNIADFRNALSGIKSDIETIDEKLDDQSIKDALSGIKIDIETVQPLIDKADLSGSIDVEVQMLIGLSGLEIKMTQFASTSPSVRCSNVALGSLEEKMMNFASDLRKKLA